MELKELAERKNILEKDIIHALKVLIDEFVDDVGDVLPIPEIAVDLNRERDFRPSATCKYKKYFDVSVNIKIPI